MKYLIKVISMKFRFSSNFYLLPSIFKLSPLPLILIVFFYKRLIKSSLNLNAP